MGQAFQTSRQDAQRTPTRRRRGLPLLTVALVLLAAIAALALLQRHVDIDVNSGRLRTRIKVGPIVVSETIQPTAFSKLMDNGDQRNDPLWRNVDANGIATTHGRYGFAASELKRFVIVCDNSGIGPDEQRALGQELLRLLRDEDFGAVQRIIDEIETRAKATMCHWPRHALDLPSICAT